MTLKNFIKARKGSLMLCERATAGQPRHARDGVCCAPSHEAPPGFPHRGTAALSAHSFAPQRRSAPQAASLGHHPKPTRAPAALLRPAARSLTAIVPACTPPPHPAGALAGRGEALPAPDGRRRREGFHPPAPADGARRFLQPSSTTHPLSISVCLAFYACGGAGVRNRLLRLGSATPPLCPGGCSSSTHQPPFC